MDIKEMFDSIAARYDLLNDLISLGRHMSIKKRSISKIPLKPGDHVLDLCTGTGDIALLLDKAVKVTAVDFSEKMLNIARKRTKDRDNIEFIQADVMDLPFEDNSFNAVFISFGLRNLPDIQKAILEMKRVVKPGGYVLNLDTGKPKGILAPLINFYFFKLVPLLGSAYSYLPESTIKFPSQQRLVEIFYELGFSNVKNYDYVFGAISSQVAVLSDS